MDTQRLYSLDAVAEQLDVSRRTVERLISDGALRSLLVRRRRLVPRDEIERFLAAPAL